MENNKFYDRIGQNLNKKILEVENVERDESGEVVRLYVEEVRNDSEGLVEEGTKLNSVSLNQILYEMLNTYASDFIKVYKYSENLSVPTEATTDFTLQLSEVNDPEITWESNNSHISIDRNTARVSRGNVDADVELTATIIYGLASYKKTFIVTIPAGEITDSERVSLDIDGLSVPSRVTADFDLVTVGENESSISWSSSNESRIAISNGHAYVTRGSSNVTVILTATATYGSSEDSKAFSVVVEANGQSTTSYRLSQQDISLNMFTNEAQTVDGLVVSADNGNGIYVEVNNPNTNCLNIYPRNDGSMQVTVVVEEIPTNMPLKDGTYDFEITIKNLDNTVLGTEYITLLYV